jgi:CubicO group peptidase (beta-lactamase class C family)
MMVADPATIGLDVAALDRLDSTVRADIDAGRNFGASILVARGGRIGHRATFGIVAEARSAADDDKYLMMSVSKSFTAALVLRAIDRGVINLDTFAADVIPGFGAGGKKRVTVRMLLTHTAGTFPGMTPPGVAAARTGDLSAFVDAVSAQPATHYPGHRVVYNAAAGYAVLGEMLVRTDRERRCFSDIARQDLFEPLGMHDTAFGIGHDDPRRVPVSYTADSAYSASKQVTAALDCAFVAGAEVPGGNGFSTVEDVFRFTEAWRRRGTVDGHRVISPALWDYARQNHTGTMADSSWDYERESRGIPEFPANFTLLGGFQRGHGHYMNGCGDTSSPETVYSVGGGSTMWMIDPLRDLTFVFLSAGFIDGLRHLERLRRLSGLAVAACL